MAFTYDTDNSIGRVRLLINDVNEDTAVFSDGDIEAFLTLDSGVVKLAAAQALDTIADDEVLTSKVITSRDLSTNGAQVAAQLRARAAELRRQAGTGQNSDAGVLSPRGCFPPAPRPVDPAEPLRGRRWTY